MTDVTVTNEAPPGNSAEARTADGTLKDQSSANTTHTQTDQNQSTNGDSFLTKKADDTAAKTDDTTKTDDKKDDTKKDDAVAGAPEKYADFKLPDGFAFDKERLEAAHAQFKELNLTQEGAQKLVDFYAKNALEAANAPYKAWADLQKSWTDEIASRFPGDKGKEVQSMISGVLDSALPPTLAKNVRAALDLTGAGSHPDVVEALNILLKPLSEGTPVKGNGPTKESQRAPDAGPPSVADAIYPHLRKQ
jgi:hypothetical protein